MDSSNNNVIFTPCRKLDFISDENITKKKNIVDSNGESLAIEGQSNITQDKIPKIGMEFDTEKEAFQFYNQYAKLVGFSVRKQYIHQKNGRILDRTYCCSRQGSRQPDKRDINVKCHQPESRTMCGAMLMVNVRYTGKYKVVKFVAEHSGHELASPQKVHFMWSHRNMTNGDKSQANDISSSGISPRDGFALMAKQVGGRENVGFIYADYKNYLRTKRTVEIKIGDTGGVLEYLQQRQFQDPNFFYAIQVDEDDLIANIVWIDAQMKADYANFGDVVCFDTTYRKNKEGRPFALFVGVNHHKQTVIFGVALLYDETASTFMWLFDTFARAMSGKEPKTILTDQDPAMAKALATKWPETYHRLCIWHIYQNAAIHLSSVFSRFTSFANDFSSCIYDYDEEDEFNEAWENMLKKYGLENNEWLGRMFKIKEKWALVYGRQTFCADMTTTQRSESMNSVLKRYVSYKHNLLQFFHQFDRLIEDRRYQELKANFRNSQSRPVISFQVEILKHATTVYMHKVFGLFQNEVRKSYDSRVEMYGENGDISEYKVASFGKNYKHIVTYDSSKHRVSCSCKKFEFAGILCSHALKVLSLKEVFNIPEFYILKRWTKKAKNTVVKAQSSGLGVGHVEPTNEEEEKKMIRSNYQELCSLSSQLLTRAASIGESFKIVKAGLLKMIEEVEASLENRVVAPTHGSKSVAPKSTLSTVVEKQTLLLEGSENASNKIIIKGWKNKEKKPARSGKRLMSGLEKSKRGRKQKQNNVSSSSDTIENGQNSNQNLQNVTNSLSLGAPIESASFPSFMPFSQEYQVGVHNLNMVYPVEGSFLSNMENRQNFNPAVHQGLAPSYIRHDQQKGASLTELLQQQFRPQGFGPSLMSNSAARSQCEKTDTVEHGDIGDGCQ